MECLTTFIKQYKNLHLKSRLKWIWKGWSLCKLEVKNYINLLHVVLCPPSDFIFFFYMTVCNKTDVFGL